MNRKETVLISHDDLSDITGALESMGRSLTMLRSSLAGIIPDQIIPGDIEAVAGNLLRSLFPDIPYNIYFPRETLCEQTAEIARDLLFVISSLSRDIISAGIQDSITLQCEKYSATANIIYARSPDMPLLSAAMKEWNNPAHATSVSLAGNSLIVTIKKI